jgi:HK97 family phage major capsid protein
MATDLSIARNTGSDPLVPEPVSAQIRQLLPAASAVMGLVPEAQRVPMSALTSRQPVLSVLPMAYFVSGDTGLKQTARQQWKNKVLNAEEIAVIVPIPENYLDDAQTPIWSQVRPRLVEAAGALVDAACIFGTNKPTTWGPPIYQKAVAAGNTTFEGAILPGDSAAGDLAAQVSYMGELLAEDGYDMDGFVSRPGLGWRLTRLRATDGTPIYNQGLRSDGNMSTLYGMPLRSLKNGAWNSTEAHLIGGDWSQAIVGVRSDISFKVFTEGVISDDNGVVVLNLMQQDSVALRMTLRLAWEVANPANRLSEDTAGDPPVESTTRWPWAVLQNAAYTYSA